MKALRTIALAGPKLLCLLGSGALFLSCVQSQVPVQNHRTFKNPELSKLKFRQKITMEDEQVPREYFELLTPGEENACARNSYMTGISADEKTILCASAYVEEDHSHYLKPIKRGESNHCEQGSFAIGMLSDAKGKLQSLMCKKYGVEYGQTIKEYQAVRPEDGHYRCEYGSFLSGLMVDGKGATIGIKCLQTSQPPHAGFNLAKKAILKVDNLIALLNKSDKIEIRSKFFSISKDYYVFVGGRQVAIADGALLSLGYRYSLVDLNNRFYLRANQQVLSLLSKVRMHQPKVAPSLPFRNFTNNQLAESISFETPLQIALGRNMKIFRHGKEIGKLDQRNFTFLVEYDIYSGTTKQYFIDQRFHLFRRVYQINRLGPGSVTMAEAVWQL